MRRILMICQISVLLVILINGCGSRPSEPGDTQHVSIAASLKQLGVGGSVTRVLLEIRGSDFSTITQELSINQGIVRAEVEVLFGRNRVFALTAFAGQTALYFGADTVDVSAGAVTEVSIYMRPQVPMVRVTPTYTSTTSIGLEGTFKIEAFNMDSLFGLALRLETDTTVIKFAGAEAGTLLGTLENTLFFVQTYPHYLAIGYTMRGNSGQPMGVSGSGLVATIRFVAKAVGNAPVIFLPENLSLIDWQGNPLPREGQVYIESGEVEVIGT